MFSSRKKKKSPNRKSLELFLPGRGIPSQRGMLSPLWNPDNFFDSFDETFSSLFEEIFGDQGRFKDIAKGKASYPKTDVSISDGLITFRMAVPGMQKEDIEISLNEEELILTVKSQKKEDKENKEKSFLIKELKHSSFSRSWSIPSFDDDRGDELSSSLNDGILEISVPIIKDEKKNEYKSRKILIDSS